MRSVGCRERCVSDTVEVEHNKQLATEQRDMNWDIASVAGAQAATEACDVRLDGPMGVGQCEKWPHQDRADVPYRYEILQDERTVSQSKGHCRVCTIVANPTFESALHIGAAMPN